MASKGLKPGQKAPASGQYQQIGPRGGKAQESTQAVHDVASFSA